MSENKTRSTFLQSMVAILWAFLGVRKGKGQEQDMASLSFVHVIIAAVVGVIIFMGLLLLIVKLVLLK
ncbi:DUF2970 domain-containing protein [Polynucleobacter rarus]|jgi:hypothetical protein|uniref:DUF2970 domain-containing protein n=1 Tax=Polynucleobacter rarus TaxID=556055 RepID=UPI000D3E1005|nr:DUF2970 domain-containing protein [Polynucleobacter rarus]